MKTSKGHIKIENRKADHIDLTAKSQMNNVQPDRRFYYEPVLSNMIRKNIRTEFGEFVFDAPIWVSSMTGGTTNAGKINENLSRISNKYNLGMGLGSCRQLLDSNTHLKDFSVRKFIGERPLFANLGISQVESLLAKNKFYKINELVDKLEANGLIIHINPMQEFTQPGGDKIQINPVLTIKKLLNKAKFKLIIKEVGQGFGINSLRELMQLPLWAIEFGAFGGTNFTKLELMRNDKKWSEQYLPLMNVGHNAEEMVEFVNYLKNELNNKNKCTRFIISGGIRDFLDGYYLTEKIEYPALYGMASAFLKPAMESYDELDEFVAKHIEGLRMVSNFLRIKNN